MEKKMITYRNSIGREVTVKLEVNDNGEKRICPAYTDDLRDAVKSLPEGPTWKILRAVIDTADGHATRQSKNVSAQADEVRELREKNAQLQKNLHGECEKNTKLERELKQAEADLAAQEIMRRGSTFTIESLRQNNALLHHQLEMTQAAASPVSLDEIRKEKDRADKAEADLASLRAELELAYGLARAEATRADKAENALAKANSDMQEVHDMYVSASLGRDDLRKELECSTRENKALLDNLEEWRKDYDGLQYKYALATRDLNTLRDALGEERASTSKAWKALAEVQDAIRPFEPKVGK
jgi:chromosome segregation ATPase